jgi:hypothetical protein
MDYMPKNTYAGWKTILRVPLSQKVVAQVDVSGPTPSTASMARFVQYVAILAASYGVAELPKLDIEGELLPLIAETLGSLDAAMNEHSETCNWQLGGCSCGANEHNAMLSALSERWVELQARLAPEGGEDQTK